jgi:hypothetical protein
MDKLDGNWKHLIVGGVFVTVRSGDLFSVGHFLEQHIPASTICADLSNWNRVASTNCGIMLSVALNAYAARTYLARTWRFPLENDSQAEKMLGDLDELAVRQHPQSCSVDACLYLNAGAPHIRVTLFESFMVGIRSATPLLAGVEAGWGTEEEARSWTASVWSTGKCPCPNHTVGTTVMKPHSGDASS